MPLPQPAASGTYQVEITTNPEASALSTTIGVPMGRAATGNFVVQLPDESVIAHMALSMPTVRVSAPLVPKEVSPTRTPLWTMSRLKTICEASKPCVASSSAELVTWMR